MLNHPWLNTLPAKLGFAKEPDMYAVLQTLGKHAFDYSMIKL